MKRPNPTKGLLIYAFHSASGNLAVAFLLSIALAAASLITANTIVSSIFESVAILGPAHLILMSMSGKAGYRWERFQITMPVRRIDLVKALYLQVLLSVVVALPLVIAVAALSSALYGNLSGFNVLARFGNIARVLAMPLVTAGLLFPLACTKIGEERQEALFVGCTLVSTVFPQLLVWMVVAILGLSADIVPLLILMSVALIFAVSYTVTKQIYAKHDF